MSKARGGWGCSQGSESGKAEDSKTGELFSGVFKSMTNRRRAKKAEGGHLARFLRLEKRKASVARFRFLMSEVGQVSHDLTHFHAPKQLCFFELNVLTRNDLDYACFQKLLQE